MNISTLSKKYSKFRAITRNVGDDEILQEIIRVVSRFFDATFRVISRKIDYIWDRVIYSTIL